MKKQQQLPNPLPRILWSSRWKSLYHYAAMVPESWQGKTSLQQTFFLRRSTFVLVWKFSAVDVGQLWDEGIQITLIPVKSNAERPLIWAFYESRTSFKAVRRIESSTDSESIQQEIESQCRKEKLQPWNNILWSRTRTSSVRIRGSTERKIFFVFKNITLTTYKIQEDYPELLIHCTCALMAIIEDLPVVKTLVRAISELMLIPRNQFDIHQ